MEEGFHPKLLTSSEVILEKESLSVRLPHQKNMTSEQVKAILSEAKIGIEAFEEYARVSRDYFDKLIDLSIRTPSENKKGGNDSVK